MIAGATRGRGGRHLWRHLLKTDGGQQVALLPARYLSATDLPHQLQELVASASHGRTDQAVYHVHVDPPAGCDVKAVISTFAMEFEKEFGLQGSPRCGVLHRKEGRTHAHIVYSLVKADGKVISLSHEYARREKVSRITEFRHGLPMIRGRHNRAVYNALVREGRADVTAAMERLGLLGGPRPAARMTPAERHQQERTKVSLPDIRQAVHDAWSSKTAPEDFRRLLKKAGLLLAEGQKGAVVVDGAGGVHSLARLLSVAARQASTRISTSTIRAEIADLKLKPVDEVFQGRVAQFSHHDLIDKCKYNNTYIININQNSAYNVVGGNRVTHAGAVMAMGNSMKIERQAPKNDPKVRALWPLVGEKRAEAWAQHVRFARAAGPSTPARIMMTDRSWLEVGSDVIRTWGPKGKAQELADVIAELKDRTTEALAEGVTFRSASPGLCQVTNVVTISNFWHGLRLQVWRDEADDSVWVSIGDHVRIHDTGDRVTVHGVLNGTAAQALIHKARHHWGGSCELTGPWSQGDQDVLWLEGQRQGVEIGGCRPSQAVRRIWEQEQLKAQSASNAMKSLADDISSVTSMARDVIDAAGGDAGALGRLSLELRAFVAGYLDDDQRQHLASACIADVIPMLAQFKTIGRQENALHPVDPTAAQPQKKAKPEDKQENDYGRGR